MSDQPKCVHCGATEDLHRNALGEIITEAHGGQTSCENPMWCALRLKAQRDEARVERDLLAREVHPGCTGELDVRWQHLVRAHDNLRNERNAARDALRLCVEVLRQAKVQDVDIEGLRAVEMGETWLINVDAALAAAQKVLGTP